MADGNESEGLQLNPAIERATLLHDIIDAITSVPEAEHAFSISDSLAITRVLSGMVEPKKVDGRTYNANTSVTIIQLGSIIQLISHTDGAVSACANYNTVSDQVSVDSLSGEHAQTDAHFKGLLGRVAYSRAASEAQLALISKV